MNENKFYSYIDKVLDRHTFIKLVEKKILGELKGLGKNDVLYCKDSFTFNVLKKLLKKYPSKVVDKFQTGAIEVFPYSLEFFVDDDFKNIFLNELGSYKYGKFPFSKLYQDILIKYAELLNLNYEFILCGYFIEGINDLEKIYPGIKMGMKKSLSILKTYT